jgi:Leucine-rich repeat (LRR) protein
MLFCGDNQLTSIDVTKNIALEYFSCSDNHLAALDVTKNRILTWLDCSGNQLTVLDVSKNMGLKSLSCCRNKIKGENMDNLISCLPQNNTTSKREFVVISNNGNDKGNVCTKDQVTAVKAKGWTPMYDDDSNWKDFEGSEEEKSTLNP